MSNKKYVFYPPKNSQFFFPKENFKEFQKFYVPYSIKAKIFWCFFKNSKLIRKLFLVEENKIPLPLIEIKEALQIQGEDYRCLINLGTKGEEQKATIIAQQKNKSCFLKFAQSEIASGLVENEYAILKELQHQHIIKVPFIIDYRVSVDKSYIALITNVIKGDKLKQIKLSQPIINLLVKLSEIKPHKNEKIIKVFSHGDFCPWNILIDNKNNFVLIDWEAGGYKPLGYDLFTFIFQTAFLLEPKQEVLDIIKVNKSFINKYFESFDIISWQPYVYQFARLKVELEQAKKDSLLKHRFEGLLNYYE